MLKIEFYVPIEQCDVVKDAMFAAGAGQVGADSRYDRCAWQTLGRGQFRPLSGSQPAIGSQGVNETVEEYKVELFLEASCLSAVLAAMRQSHPYEQPVYSVVEVLDV